MKKQSTWRQEPYLLSLRRLSREWRILTLCLLVLSLTRCGASNAKRSASAAARASNPTACVLEGTISSARRATSIAIGHVTLEALSNPTDDSTPALRQVSVAELGAFRLDVQGLRGFFELTISAPDHQPERAVLYLDPEQRPLTIRATLAPYAIRATPEPALIGSFNDFALEQGTIPMTRAVDGAYHGEIVTDDPGIEYQIVGLVQPLFLKNQGAQDYGVNAPGSASMVLAPDGHYRSKETSREGRLEVTLVIPESDPDAQGALLVYPEESASARFVQFERAQSQAIDAYLDAYQALLATDPNVETIDGFNKNYARAPLSRALSHFLASSPSTHLRNAAYLSYLHHVGGRLDSIDATFLDASIVAQTIKDISPLDPIWSTSRNALFSLTWSHLIQPITGVDEYLDEYQRAHADETIKAELLGYRLDVASYGGHDDQAQRLYQTLITAYPDTDSARRARKNFSSDKAVWPGKPVPSFAFVGLDGETYSKEKLLGRPYLIDFWGTWCAPCLHEMPLLHELYETYKDGGFTIVSVACEPDDDSMFHRFREKRWSMPWIHHVIQDCSASDDHPLLTTFEVTSFPAPVLVDAAGLVVAVRADAMGEDLREEVRRLFTKE